MSEYYRRGAKIGSNRGMSFISLTWQVYRSDIAHQAGMFAIRARRKVATERDFLDAVEKVVRQGTKFSST